jgi:hypothetical protein
MVKKEKLLEVYFFPQLLEYGKNVTVLSKTQFIQNQVKDKNKK